MKCNWMHKTSGFQSIHPMCRMRKYFFPNRIQIVCQEKTFICWKHVDVTLFTFVIRIKFISSVFIVNENTCLFLLMQEVAFRPTHCAFVCVENKKLEYVHNNNTFRRHKMNYLLNIVCTLGYVNDKRLFVMYLFIFFEGHGKILIHANTFWRNYYSLGIWISWSFVRTLEQYNHV